MSDAIDIDNSQNRGVPATELFWLVEVVTVHLFAFQIVIEKNLDATNLG